MNIRASSLVSTGRRRTMIGGTSGFAEFLDAMTKPRHPMAGTPPQRRQLERWYGGRFDPADISIDIVEAVSRTTFGVEPCKGAFRKVSTDNVDHTSGELGIQCELSQLDTSWHHRPRYIDAMPNKGEDFCQLRHPKVRYLSPQDDGGTSELSERLAFYRKDFSNRRPFSGPSSRPNYLQKTTATNHY
ncbi:MULTISPECIES: plasmid pRiA4b ORF-3 family protein [Rhizobium]|uniref:plasmid pRiA4b ORF-3 family protein n=1 Tax=Rhizobium TaxID=379 RepID=UPI001F3E4C85|nr:MULTISPECIES: plasmid pRiA4b ORF-3 family protein [Rhizobium]WEO69882.1 plasmid pRiA4b ORF-3 family protein [Rhizobium rhizogenes]